MNIRADHVKHFAVCLILMAILLVPAQWMGWWVIVAVTATLTVGVMKEIHDIKTTGFDWTDIAADVAGILVALMLFGLMEIT